PVNLRKCRQLPGDVPGGEPLGRHGLRHPDSSPVVTGISIAGSVCPGDDSISGRSERLRSARGVNVTEGETAMRRAARFGAVGGTVGAFGLGTVGASPAVGQAQVSPPPPPGAQAQAVPQGLGALARQLGDEVRALGQAIAAELKNAPRGGQLLESANELARAVDDFRDAVNAQADRFQARQAFSGVDASWHHLARGLARSGASPPGVARAVRRVGQADAQLHRALAMNEAPAGYYELDQAASGMAELQRLVHALVDRAEGLAGVVRADMVGPGNAQV